MRAMELPKESKSFLDATETVSEETLVFTRKKRPVAAFVSLRNVDREALALGTNQQFLTIIEAARKEVRAGKTISLAALEKKYKLAAASKIKVRARKTSVSS